MKKSEAMLAPFQPVVPCRVMETRPCVNLPPEGEDLGELDDWYRDDECPGGECARFTERGGDRR